jgi:hypothetical protein
LITHRLVGALKNEWRVLHDVGRSDGRFGSGLEVRQKRRVRAQVFERVE